MDPTPVHIRTSSLPPQELRLFREQLEQCCSATQGILLAIGDTPVATLDKQHLHPQSLSPSDLHYEHLR